MNQHKYFIGICPPHPLEKQIHGIKEEFYQKYGIKGAFRSKAHITLQMPFNLVISKEEKLITELTDLLKEQKSFSINLRDFQCFEPRVVYLNVVESADMNVLQKRIEKMMKRFQVFNGSHKNRGFNPHITVAFRDLKKAIFYEIWEEVKTRPFQESFWANTLTIFRHNGKSWDVFKELKFDYTQ
jgi:2'-5' RNA ligase